MKLTHDQARLRFEAAMDTAHYYGEKAELDPFLAAHLAECPECRAYTEQASVIDAYLTRNLPRAWRVPEFSNQKMKQASNNVHDRIKRRHLMNHQKLVSIPGVLATVLNYLFKLGNI